MAIHNTDKHILYFHEEVLLLALREEDGRTDSKASNYRIMMAAALLAELMLRDRIAIDDTKKMIVTLKSEKPIGDPVLDRALEKVATSRKERGAAHWVQVFSDFNTLRDGTGASLCERGIVQREDGKRFFFFNATFYPELDPKPEQKILARLERAIFTETRDIDERTLVLLALLRKSALLKMHFDKGELKDRRHRMKELSEGDQVGKAAQKAIQAAQAAVAAAAAVTVVITAS